MGRIEEIKKKREKRFKNERLKDAKRRNVELVDRLLTAKPEYIKNEDLKEKFLEKKNNKIQDTLRNAKKSKLQEELMVNSDEEDDEEDSDVDMGSDASDNQEGSGMEEEELDE